MAERKKAEHWRLIFPIMGAIFGGLMFIPTSGTPVAWYGDNLINSMFALEGWHALTGAFIYTFFLIFIGFIFGMFFYKKRLATYILIVVALITIGLSASANVTSRGEKMRQKKEIMEYTQKNCVTRGELAQKLGISEKDIKSFFKYYKKRYNNCSINDLFGTFINKNTVVYRYKVIKDDLNRFMTMPELSKYFEVDENIIKDILEGNRVGHIMVSNEKKYDYHYKIAKYLNKRGLLKDDQKNLLYY